MLVQRCGPDWKVLAPAKLNLQFEIIAKRGDGYHEIESLMVPVSLRDEVRFRPTQRSEIHLECRSAMGRDGPARPSCLPPAADNLVVRAVELLRSRAGVSRGAVIHLIKRIPTAAGLGGGSSDAAAALLAADAAWETRLSEQELHELAAELGSDVPFFLGRSPAICRGRGERVEPVAGLGPLWLVIASPPHGLRTADVFAKARVPALAHTSESLIAALRSRDWRRVGPLLQNRLREAATELSPWIQRLLGCLASEDLIGQQMSGSGSACFGICRSARHAGRVARRLRQRGWSNSVAAVSYG